MAWEGASTKVLCCRKLKGKITSSPPCRCCSGPVAPWDRCNAKGQRLDLFTS